ncbi:hypothetical protein QYE47_23280 [Pseudomonas sp. 2,4-D]|uniref:hypothetical protein n=1 Tax=Pseudomonas sp. 2,4-D TaxID=3058433 RepID=UPI00261AAF7B|nr:hypothetical protein [Pseudomonas sp. 2,4-D]MDN4515448.1 hypothetical protein [Pseudomonas sp. 2,4-D]
MKHHYYLFSFSETVGVESRTVAATLGLQQQQVTQAAIERVRNSICKSSGAVLLAVSYLGHMTEEEFKG